MRSPRFSKFLTTAPRSIRASSVRFKAAAVSGDTKENLKQQASGVQGPGQLQGSGRQELMSGFFRAPWPGWISANHCQSLQPMTQSSSSRGRASSWQDTLIDHLPKTTESQWEKGLSPKGKLGDCDQKGERMGKTQSLPAWSLQSKKDTSTKTHIRRPAGRTQEVTQGPESC